MYVSKLTGKAKQKDAFYFTPLQSIPADPQKTRFTAVPIGVNKLATLVKEMISEVSFDGKNKHSLWATGATGMYNHGIPQKMIEQRTGHMSRGGLRVYEQPGEEQHHQACKALSDITNNAAAACSSSCSSPFPFLASRASRIVFKGPVTLNYGPQEVNYGFPLSQKKLKEFKKFDDWLSVCYVFVVHVLHCDVAVLQLNCIDLHFILPLLFIMFIHVYRLLFWGHAGYTVWGGY